MQPLTDLSAAEARLHFLKGCSYFNTDLPRYISFEPILTEVAEVLDGKPYSAFKKSDPSSHPNVNYLFLVNKDGRLSWRRLELIHPALYVSLVDRICDEDTWALIKTCFASFRNDVVECCSVPVVSLGDGTDTAAQVRSWWHKVEQRSLEYSLEFSHVYHTDVTDCYGMLYTHSIPWAVHGQGQAKAARGDRSLAGNAIDRHVRAGRWGQSNGIPQGSVLMDFIAELVLGYVDTLIAAEARKLAGTRILRYRDDYRVFANSDSQAEQCLNVIGDKLRAVGMQLAVAKTVANTNVVDGSIKPDKLAGIALHDMGETNAKTIQKKLLRLHAFGRQFPNSGALKRLVSEMHDKLVGQTKRPADLAVQVAIATDIALGSPQAFPALAGLLSHLISLAPKGDKECLWKRVVNKLRRMPYNGYLEVWLQRVTMPRSVAVRFESEEPICKIVQGQREQLWGNRWVRCPDLMSALDTRKIVVGSPGDMDEVVQQDEVALFRINAYTY